MKFKHKVYDHKTKVGFDFASFGPNILGIRGPKGPKLNFVWFHQKLNIGLLWYAESNCVCRFLIFGPVFKLVYIKVQTAKGPKLNLVWF